MMQHSRRPGFAHLALAIVLLMALLGLVLIVIVGTRGGGAFSFAGRVGVLEVSGVIEDDEKYLEQIRDFRKDGSVKAVLVAINSPGGAVAPSQSVYRELKRLSEEHDIPVVATLGSVAASGGYYIALGADSIYTMPGSMTGSIGVIMEVPDVSGLMEKVGVGMQVVKSAEHKDTPSLFRPMGPSDRAVLEAMVQDVYAQFVDVVAEERKLSRESLTVLADGRVMSGNQAIAAGLADRIGNFNDALAAAGRMAGLGDEPRYVRPKEKEPTLIDVLLGRAFGGVRGITQVIEQSAAPRLKYAVPF